MDEVKAWLVNQCDVSLEDIDDIISKLQSSRILSLENFHRVVQECESVFQLLNLPVFYEIKIKQELKDMFNTSVNRLSAHELASALKSLNFSQNLSDVINCNDISGLKYSFVDEHTWIYKFNIEIFEYHAMREVFNNWQTNGVPKSLLCVSQKRSREVDEISLNLDCFDDLDPFIPAHQPCAIDATPDFSISDITPDSPPPELTENMIMEIMKEYQGTSEEDESSGQSAEYQSSSSTRNAAELEFKRGYRFKKEKVRTNTPRKKQKLTNIATEMKDINSSISAFMDSSTPPAIKIGLVETFIKTLKQTNGKCVDKFLSKDVMDTLLHRVVKSQSQELICQNTLILINLIIHYGSVPKLRSFCKEGSLIIIPMRCIESSFPSIKYESLHIISNLAVCDADIHEMLLKKDIFGLITKEFENITDPAMANRVAIVLCQIHRKMPVRIENIDYIKINLPVLEQLLSIDDYYIQLNVLGIIEIICEPEIPSHLQVILDSHPIMQRILHHLQSSKTRLLNEAALVISSIAAGSEDQSVQLLALQPPIIPLLKGILSCPHNNTFRNTARKECYRIIANLCASNSNVLNSIIESNLYSVLLSFIEYYQHNAGMKNKGAYKMKKDFEEMYEHCCTGICFAIHGATFQQIHYYLNKNVLYYLHNIFKKPPNDQITLEVLNAYERLLDATDIDSELSLHSTMNLSQIAQVSQSHDMVQFLVKHEMQRLKTYLSHKNHHIRDTALTIYDYLQLKSKSSNIV